MKNSWLTNFWLLKSVGVIQNIFGSLSVTSIVKTNVFIFCVFVTPSRLNYWTNLAISNEDRLYPGWTCRLFFILEKLMISIVLKIRNSRGRSRSSKLYCAHDYLDIPSSWLWNGEFTIVMDITNFRIWSTCFHRRLCRPSVSGWRPLSPTARSASSSRTRSERGN